MSATENVVLFSNLIHTRSQKQPYRVCLPSEVPPPKLVTKQEIEDLRRLDLAISSALKVRARLEQSILDRLKRGAAVEE